MITSVVVVVVTLIVVTRVVHGLVIGYGGGGCGG